MSARLALVAAAICCAAAVPMFSAQSAPNSILAQGQQIFRHDTFGDEQLWTDTLQLHTAIAKVTPNAALDAGLQVDVEALPAALVAMLRAGLVNLDDPAVTLELLRLDAVVGVKGRVSAGGALQSIGLTCAFCHSVVDDSLAPGIGRRLDGWPNRKLNVGAIVALSPVLTNAQRSVFKSWGPRQVRPAPPGLRRHAARLAQQLHAAGGHPARLRPAPRRLRDLHRRRTDLVLEQLRGGVADGRARQLQRSADRADDRADARPGHAQAGGAARVSTEPPGARAAARQLQTLPPPGAGKRCSTATRGAPLATGHPCSPTCSRARRWRRRGCMRRPRRGWNRCTRRAARPADIAPRRCGASGSIRRTSTTAARPTSPPWSVTTTGCWGSGSARRSRRDLVQYLKSL